MGGRWIRRAAGGFLVFLFLFLVALRVSGPGSHAPGPDPAARPDVRGGRADGFPPLVPFPEPGRMEEGVQKPDAGALRDMTVLLIGVDRRGRENGRSDTIVLARVRPAERELALVSIPRDTRVRVPGVGFTKINHAAAYGGVPLLKTTLEQWLDIPIDHWVLVDFEGFCRLVDRMGGVPVDVEKAMDYDDPSDGTHIHLPPGRQWLDGRAALDYARFRGDPEADAGRVRRQLQLLRAILLRGSNPALWPGLLRETARLHEHFATDLGQKTLAKTALALYPFDQIHVRAEVLKGVSFVDRRDGVWYVEPDRQAVESLRRAFSRLPS